MLKLHFGLAGWGGQPARASYASIDIQTERERHYRTRKLDYQATHEVKGNITVLYHSCLEGPVL